MEREDLISKLRQEHTRSWLVHDDPSLLVGSEQVETVPSWGQQIDQSGMNIHRPSTEFDDATLK